MRRCGDDVVMRFLTGRFECIAYRFRCVGIGFIGAEHDQRQRAMMFIRRDRIIEQGRIGREDRCERLSENRAQVIGVDRGIEFFAERGIGSAQARFQSFGRMLQLAFFRRFFASRDKDEPRRQ